MREEEGDRRPAKPVTHEVGCDLSAISVAELEARVGLLEAEIGRLRAEHGRKLASRAAADAFFQP